ncbi:MAG: hypothetical protein WCO57_09365 [Verrucomicrobiota bacterium]
MELRPVDDDPVPKLEMIRLGDGPQPVRLVPENPVPRQKPVERLEIPAVEAPMESRRTHEPGPEVLLELDLAGPVTGEETWGGIPARREPLPWGWFALLGLLLTWAVIWSVSHVRQAEPLLAEAHQLAVDSAHESAASDLTMTQLLKRIETTVKTFCEATSIEAMQPLVRDPERVRPLMEQYYGQHPLHPLGCGWVNNIRNTVLDNTDKFWELSAVLGDGQTQVFLLEETPDGSLRVDWESVVTYQPMKWDDYALQRPAGTTLDFRVLVDDDHFFSHEFRDTNRWTSFRLTAPGGEETLFGYALRDGPVATALRELLQKNAAPQTPAILRLKLPPGMLSRRGVVIDKVLSSRWIYVTPPDFDP